MGMFLKNILGNYINNERCILSFPAAAICKTLDYNASFCIRPHEYSKTNLNFCIKPVLPFSKKKNIYWSCYNNLSVSFNK